MSLPEREEITRYGKHVGVWRDPATGRFVASPLSYIFRWIGVVDDRTCAKCRRLIGRTWEDQDLFQNVLWDPFEGDIFDLDRGISLAHGSGPHFCRCTVTVDVIVDETKLMQYLGGDELEKSLEWALR